MSSQQLALVQAVAAALEEACRFLSTSYGPLGLDKLVLTSTNQLLVTNSGHAILPLFPVSNIVAQHAMKAIVATAAKLHDGSSSLLLMVGAALGQVLKHVGSDAGLGQSSQQLLLSVVSSLGELKSQLLPHLLDVVLRHQATHVKEDDSEGVRQALHGVIHTAWAGKTGSNVSRQLEPLVVDLIMKHREREQQHTFSQVCKELARHPPVITVPGLPVSSSRLLDGLLLRATFSSRHMPTELHSCKFIVLDHSLELEVVDGEQVHVTSQQQFQQLQQHKEMAVRRRLELLGERGVQLIMCTEKVSELTSFLALQCNISIIPLISEEDVGRICVASGIAPVTSNVHSALLEAPIGHATVCRQVSLSVSCKVILLETHTQVQTLAVCAPSEGLGAQYSSLIRGALHLLADVPGGIDNSQGLCFIRGGGAFDASVAVVLEELIDSAMQKRSTHPLLQRLTALHWSPSSVTAALKVLLAMAKAPLTVLATSAGRQGGWGPSATNSTHTHTSAKQLVEEVLAAHRAVSPCHLGLVAPSMATVVPDTQQDSEPGWMCLADPAEYGILEAAAAKVSMWQSAVDILHQVLRLDAVLPSHRLAKDKEADVDSD